MTVYKGKFQGKNVAIKELSLLSPREQEDFIREVEILTRFKHPNIVEFYGITESPYRIIMEFMAKGYLYQILHSDEHLSWVQRIQWSARLAEYCFPKI